MKLFFARSVRFASLGFFFLLGSPAWSATQSVIITGLERTKEETILDLLPRPLPADFTEAELDELKRRIKNLALFDWVEVTPKGSELHINVRRKTTLVPVLGLSTGKTLSDTTVTLGFVEYDIAGSATRLRVQGSYNERGPNVLASLTQHPYSPNRWATEYQLSYTNSGFRFESGADTWTRHRFGGLVELISPFKYGSRLQFEIALIPYYELSAPSAGSSAPNSGFHFGGLFEAIYDAYRWDDLEPSGYRLVAELRPGIFSGTGVFRGETRLKALTSVVPWPRAAFLVNANLALTNTGNANHSLLVGSQQGVRGLSDSLYRTFAQAFVNAELRYAIQIYQRWYVQPVAFVDAAIFNSMDAVGNPTYWRPALSTGLGLRVVPTGLVHTLLRVDGSRLFFPTESWFIQGGITQYF